MTCISNNNFKTKKSSCKIFFYILSKSLHLLIVALKEFAVMNDF